MAALAYLLLPISGAIAYFRGRHARTRFHGLQALLLGLVWPLALYGASALDPGATFAVLIVGTAAWLVLFLGTASGKDPSLPGLSGWLRRGAEHPPGGTKL